MRGKGSEHHGGQRNQEETRQTDKGADAHRRRAEKDSFPAERRRETSGGEGEEESENGGGQADQRGDEKEKRKVPQKALFLTPDVITYVLPTYKENDILM